MSSLDAPGIPLDLLILAIIVMPIVVVGFFGLFAFRHNRCPHCRSRAWNSR